MRKEKMGCFKKETARLGEMPIHQNIAQTRVDEVSGPFH